MYILRCAHLLRGARHLSPATAPGARRSHLSRDWRPEDRTRHRRLQPNQRDRHLARSGLHRVAHPPLLIWNPQFRRWAGSVRSAQSARRSRGCSPRWPIRSTTRSGSPGPNGWVHYQPELQLWDQGVVPDGVVSHRLRSEQSRRRALSSAPGGGWQLLPRGGMVPVPAQRARHGRSWPASRRAGAPQQPRAPGQCGAILTDSSLRNVPLHRGRALVRQSGVVSRHLRASALLYVQDGAAIPERLPLRPAVAIGSARCSAGPAGSGPAPTALRWRMPRSRSCESDLREFRSRPRPAGHWDAVQPGARAGRAGQGDLGRDRPRRGANRSGGRSGSSWSTRAAGCPTAGSTRSSSRPAGRITVGTARGIARMDDSLRVDAGGAALRRRGLRGLPGGRLGLGRHPARLASGRCPGRRTWCGRQGLASASAPGAGRGSRYAGRHAGGAHPRPDRSGAIRGPGVDPRPQPLRPARPASPLRARRPGLLGRGRARRRVRAAAHAAAPPAARGRPARRQRTISRWIATISGSRPTAAWCASGSTPFARDPSAPRATGDRRLVPDREFDRIRQIAARPGRPRTADWATTARCCADGEDAGRVSTDVSVEGVHFRLDWIVARGGRLARHRGGAVGSGG